MIQNIKTADKKVTIDYVAKLCGVSKTTISRFLNGKYDNFSEETRQKIEKVIKELNYSPNRSAQRLKSAKSGLIGCIIADISSPFSAMLLKGVSDVCDEKGYQVLFSSSGDSPEREAEAIRRFLDNRVDGLIVNTTSFNDELLLSVKDSGTPVVMADRRLFGDRQLDTVENMNEQACYECVELLRDYRYDRIAFFTEGNRHVSPRIQRYEGYLRGISSFYPQCSPEVYEFERGNIDDCIEKITSFTGQHPGERLGIITVNGLTSLHLLLASNKMGIKCGAEIGLCSFDDWEWFMLATPGITSVKLNSVEIGRRSAEILLEYIGGARDMYSDPVTIQLPTKINVRGSTIKK